ncbi:MAG: GNAT family N-acetyltransferase [Croceivirga sp.]
MEHQPEISINTATKAEIKTIIERLNTFNLAHHPAKAAMWTPLEFVMRDDNGQAIGGVLGGIGYWNGLEIKILWVTESQRNQGYGTQLLEHMEEEAKRKGAEISMLDTFDFQAEGFYLKHGYQAIGEIMDFPKGHRRTYFSKKLL